MKFFCYNSITRLFAYIAIAHTMGVLTHSCQLFAQTEQSETPQVRRGNGVLSGRVRSMVSHNNQLFAVVTDAAPFGFGTQTITQNGLYRSQDAGVSWAAVASFPAPSLALSLFSHRNALYVLTSSNGLPLYRSGDNGATWEIVSKGTFTAVTHLAAMGDTLFARTGLEIRIGTMFISADSGKTWSFLSTPGSIGSVVSSQGRSSAALGRTLLFGGAPNGLVRSGNRGLTWDQVPTTPAIGGVVVYDIATKANDELFLATSQGILTSSNNGLRWNVINAGLEGKVVRDLALNDNTLYAAADDGLYVRTDSVWRPVAITPSGMSLSSLNASAMLYNEGDSLLFLGTQRGIFRAVPRAMGVFAAWEQCNRGLPSVGIERHSLAQVGRVLLAASTNAGVMRASDGNLWLPSNSGLGTDLVATRLSALSAPSVAVASTKTGLFTSADAGTTWRRATISLGGGEISAIGLVSGLSMLVGTASGSIFRADDNSAQAWSKIFLNPLEGSGTSINAFAQSGIVTWCATNQGLLRSSDGGALWTQVDSAVFPRIPAWTAALALGRLLVGTNEGVYRSSDSGRSWSAPAPSARIGAVVALASRNGLWYAGTSENGLFRSADNGATWRKLTIPGLFGVTALLADSTRLVIGARNGIFELALPLPEEFPIISSVQPADSAIVGLSDVSITVNGLNFSTSASVIFGGQRLQPRSVSATQVAVTLPIALLSSIGTKTLEIVNSTAARVSTPFRIVPVPENFPRVSVTGSLEPFSTFVTAISPVQRYTISGTNLRDSVILQAPQGFELSSDGAVWLPGRIAFAPQNGTLTQNISVRFRPLLSQNVSGFITHSSGGIVLQSLAIQGNPRSLALNIEPNGVIDLGTTRVGRNLRTSVTLANPNTVGITLTTIITGANPADFSVSAQQIVIPPSGTARLEVVFAPRARGEREAIINLSGIASGQVTVRGRGVQAIFTLSPQDIIFATSAFVGQTARLPAETVRITNTGDVDDELSGLTLQGASGAFRLQGLFMPTRLQAGEVTSITLDLMPDADGTRRARLTAQAQDPFTTSNIVQLSGVGQVLLPPIITSPRAENLAGMVSIPLTWLAAPLATHYQVAMDEIANAPQLLSRNTAITTSTSVPAQAFQNRRYYWTVRSLAVSGSDTLVRSPWQNWAYFSTTNEQRISLPPVLDFGAVATEQIETAPRGQPITVSSGAWRVVDVGIVQENTSPSADFRAFRILNRDALVGSASILRPLAETYTISAAFKPPMARSRPYTALAELKVQNTLTNEILTLPFQLTARAVSCPTASSVSAGNQGCPEVLLRVQVLPRKSVYFPGDDVRLQVQLVQAFNTSPTTDRFFRQLRLTLDVESMSLLSFGERLSAGTAASGANSVRAVQYLTAQAENPALAANPDGKIRLNVVRPPNALQNVVLAELSGKAVIGLRGLGAPTGDSTESAIIRVSDVQWLSDNGDSLDAGQIITWGETRGAALAAERDSVTVNTCQTAPQGSLFLTSTFPVEIKPLAPNPVQSETTIAFSLQERAWTELDIVNVYGQTVKKILQAEMSPGEYSRRCSVLDLPTGSYFLVLRTPFETKQRRMEVVR